MIVRNLADARASSRRIGSDNWESVRLLLKSDGMGFSFHITTIYAGTETEIWYKNHLESVYCISGSGSIRDLATGQEHAIEPGVVYALDQHDKHVLIAKTELQLACVFNPPLIGTEVHDKDGAYSLEADEISEAS